ncbi:proton-coupled amino acid transporter-like protein pathetic [Planococcus citri]|uniref:proton-coupled amino acid transporter-like protein pathetic n=1 Tax=Planococcus citri TaxID=170843 RepID=UPI0031F7393A
MAEKQEKSEKNSSVIDLQSVTASNAKLTEAGYQKENGINGNHNEVYDPFSNRDTQHRTSDFGALVHLFKGSFGSGILAVPRAFMNSGLILGIFGTVVIGIICAHCVSILVKCSHILSIRDKKPSLGFSDTAEVAFKTGPTGLRKYSKLAGQFVTLSLFATYYLGNTVYVVLIAQAFQEVFNTYFHILLPIRWYILIVAVPLLPLGIGRRLKYLVPVSAFGAIFIIFGIVVTFAYALKDLPSIEERKLVNTVDHLPVFVSTILFAMEGIGTVLPIENSMKHPDHFRGYCGVLSISMSFIIAMYGVIGFFGYLKYGDKTEANITLNLPEDPLSIAVKLMVALSILFTYGLQFCVPSEIVWNRLKPSVSAKYETSAYYVMRGSMIIGTVIIALIIPNLAPFISLVGSVCLSILGLWTPAMIELVTYWEEDTGYWRVVKNIFIMVCSIGALIFGSYTSIIDIISYYTGVHE